MALTPTWIQELIAKNPTLDNRINRASRYGALDVFRSSLDSPTSIITPGNLAEFQAAIGKTMKIPVIDYDGTVTIGSTRSTTISDAENTSAYVSVSPSTLAWGFTTFPALHYNNAIDYQKDLETKFIKFLYKALATIEGLCVTKLAADKTQAITNLLGYDFTDDIVLADSTAQEKILGDLEVMLQSDDFYGPYKLIGNGGVQSLLNQLMKYNQANEKDLKLEYMNKTLHWTNGITDASGHKATGFLVEDGSVGLMTRVSNESRMNMKSTTGKEFMTIPLPILNREAEYYFYSDVVDGSSMHGSGSAHATRTIKEYHGFALDIALLTAHVTTRASQASPIVKFAITEV